MESDIIARFKTGDREAFNALYRRYSQRLMSCAVKRVQSVEDAEDLIQDVFVSLWNNRGRITNDITLYPYLFTSLCNRISRLNSQRLNSLVYLDYSDRSVRESIVSECRYSIEYDEFRRTMFVHIGKLNYTEQRVLKLSRFGDKTNRQIALILGLSDQTVRNALSTGLRKLRKTLIQNHVAI